MAKFLTNAEIVARLKAAQGGRSQSEFAAAIHVTQATLSLIYSGERKPGPKILKLLGLQHGVVEKEPK